MAKTRFYTALMFLFFGAFPMGAIAQTQTFGDWIVMPATDRSGDTVAATGIENGTKLLGVRCFAADHQCVHLLITETRCEDKSSYPLLLNASNGAALIEGICSINQGRYELLLTPFDKVRTALSGTGMIGFAIPMESGSFRALRFSLAGCAAALKQGERLLPAMGKPKVGSNNF